MTSSVKILEIYIHVYIVHLIKTFFSIIYKSSPLQEEKKIYLVVVNGQLQILDCSLYERTKEVMYRLLKYSLLHRLCNG